MKVNFVTGEGPDAKVSRRNNVRRLSVGTDRGDSVLTLWVDEEGDVQVTFWKPINVKMLT